MTLGDCQRKNAQGDYCCRGPLYLSVRAAEARAWAAELQLAAERAARR